MGMFTFIGAYINCSEQFRGEREYSVQDFAVILVWSRCYVILLTVLHYHFGQSLQSLFCFFHYQFFYTRLILSFFNLVRNSSSWGFLYYILFLIRTTYFYNHSFLAFLTIATFLAPPSPQNLCIIIEETSIKTTGSQKSV